MLKLRPYQEAAKAAVYEHIRTRDDNPCVVIPTGGGKTPVIASTCKDAATRGTGRDAACGGAGVAGGGGGNRGDGARSGRGGGSGEGGGGRGGSGFGDMSDAQRQQMRERMQNMSPQQRAEFFGGRGGGGRGGRGRGAWGQLAGRPGLSAAAGRAL